MKKIILPFLNLILFFSTTLIFSANSFGKEIKRPDSYAYNRGVESYNMGQFQDALEWFNREVSEHPDNGYAFLYIAHIRYANEEYGKALTAINEGFKNIPKKDKAWKSQSLASRAEIYLCMEDTVKALEDLGEAIKLDPGVPRFYKERAQIYYEKDNYALSDADYRKMIDLDQGDVVGYLGIGRNANAQKRWDDAISQFDYVIRLDPENSQAYSYRAISYAGKENWNSATDDIIKALDIDGEDWAYYQLRTLPQEAQELIIPKLKIQAAKQPTNNYWPYCLGEVYYRMEDYNNAAEYFDKAYKIDADPYFLQRMAACYKELGDADKALESLDTALNIDPENLTIQRQKANVLTKAGRLQEALELRSKYLESKPDDGFEYVNNGDDKMNLLLFEEAFEDYNKASALLPFLEEMGFFLVKRGDAYRLAGKEDKAKRDYNTVITLEKDSVNKSTRVAYAYTGLGENQQGIDIMLDIIKRNNSEEAVDFYNLACIYSRTGDGENAVKALQEAINRNYNEIETAGWDYNFKDLRDYSPFIALLESIKPSQNPEEEVVEVDSDEIPGEYEVVEIPFKREAGVTKVECTINGLPLHFVFDTGAADVTISMVEANFMLKNGYIKPQDIVGTARYIDANGDINEGTVINIRQVDFGGLELENVRASVVRNQKAPLLLGQSVLGRLGKIEIDNPRQKLKITHKK